MSVMHRICRVAVVPAVLGLVQAGTLAQTSSDRLPNLIPRPASNVSLSTDAAGNATLRFSTTSWNNGSGPLELVGGEVDTGSGKQQVYQRIYRSDGSWYLRSAGWFEYHAEHSHIHFNDYALYTLQPVNAPGGSQRIGQKTTFCILDNTKVDTSLPGAPASAVYTICESQTQGMSVGWGDTYGAHLAGQSIDFTGNADGVYQLKIQVDPKTLLAEGNKSDNVSCLLLDIRKPSTVTLVDASGNCSTVLSVSPNTVTAGTSVQVTVTGYGFTTGMPVTFENGTGPRPTASNVQLATDTESQDTITMTVTVPYKKQLGRDPVWDLRAGSGGALINALRVTR
jgi:hypothetical protein